ncbi:hypothetical protein NQ317_000221 [Molorchus minor]|uniref:DFDF domain-containing protein n=1 Tax=Molorchus minor TaxID=1323400 RepID=A0ABQ9J962_9CUCU|nr:hypothetical protein NQ317_000221 [Molorchus minor]
MAQWIGADNIIDLKLIDKQSDNLEAHSTITMAKPLAKIGRTQIHIKIVHPISEKKVKGNGTKVGKDEECFGSPLDYKLSKDFDFEKNLALFNKQALWDELNSQKPDVIKHADKSQPSTVLCFVLFLTHDENVIATVPTNYRQIIVPKQDFCEYVTDDGLIIPSISRSLGEKLWETAERVGLTWEKRTELIGRAATKFLFNYWAEVID